MSGSVVVREHLEHNEQSPRPRPRWWARLGILSSAALFGAFCLWVYTAVRTNDGARCQQAAASADADTIAPDDFQYDSSTASDNGRVCLVRRDMVAR